MDLEIKQYPYGMSNYQGFHLSPVPALKSQYCQLSLIKNGNIGLEILPTVLKFEIF